MKHFYEIYRGGACSGEVVVVGGAPDNDGCLVMTDAEYDASFVYPGRGMRGCSNYHEGYDVTSSGGVVVVHPASIPFNDQRIQRALQR